MRLTLLLACVLAVALFAALLIGATPMAPGRVMSALFSTRDVSDHIIVWEIRLPRALCAALVGAALGASGAAMQGLLRNPLAEPGVLGVSACATLFATVAVFWGWSALWPPATPIAAIAGALFGTGLLGAAAWRARSMVSLILVGAGLASLAGAIMALLMNLAPNPFSLADLVNWTLGSVANRSFSDLALAAPFVGAGLALLFASARNLSAFSLGEEAAAGLGVDLAPARFLVIAGVGLATGAAISLAGAIGFVGLVAPHAVRPLVRHDPARVLAPAALLGALILTIADVLARIMPTTNELKLGVLAALIGAPAFIWIALGRDQRHD